MPEEKIIMFEDGKSGFSYIPISTKGENADKEIKRIVINTSLSAFIHGIRSYINSKEKVYWGIGNSYGYDLIDVKQKKLEGGKCELIAICKSTINNEAKPYIEDIPILSVFEIRTKQIEVGLYYWNIVVDSNRVFPVLLELTNFFIIGMNSIWPEAKRQLADYYDYDIEKCDTLVFNYLLETTPETFIEFCYDELQEGKLAKYTLEYEYSVGESKSPVKTKIKYISFLPDYKNPQWDFFLIALDTYPEKNNIDYAQARIKGENNLVARFEITQTNRNKIQVKLWKSSYFPYHDKFISLLSEQVETVFKHDEIIKRKKQRKKGMSFRTEDILIYIREYYEPGMSNKDLAKIISGKVGFEDVKTKDIYYVRSRYLK